MGFVGKEGLESSSPKDHVSWALVLLPFESKALTKNKNFDEAISPDDKRKPCLGEPLGRHSAKRLAYFRSRGTSLEKAKLLNLWRFTQTAVVETVPQAGQALDIELVTQILHVLCHGGVSTVIGLNCGL